jgi:DNA polymerase III psi subunit
MHLDHIHIPGIVLQEWYATALVDLGHGHPGEISKTERKLPFLGDNHKKVAVVVEDQEAQYLTDKSLDLLLDILKACKLSMADVALVNIAKLPSLAYSDFSGQLAADKIILFGVPPISIQLPLDFPRYQVQRYDGRQYLYSADLPSLEKDKAEKTKLWTSLKQVFSIA